MRRNIGIYLGLSASLPVCVWAVGRMMADGAWQPVEILRSAVETICLLQAVAISVFLNPRLDKGSLAAFGLLILTPLPVLAIAWLAEAETVPFIFKSLAALLSYSILIQFLKAGICNYLPLDGCRQALGLALAALAWRYQENWLSWLGP